MPDDLGVTVVTNSYAFLFCMRGCGCIEHPAFPAPSEFQMRFIHPKLARPARRDRGGVGVSSGEYGSHVLRIIRAAIARSATASAVSISPTRAVETSEARSGVARSAGWGYLDKRHSRPHPSHRSRSSRCALPPHKVGGIRKSEMSLRGANVTKQATLPVGPMDCFACARNDGANRLCTRHQSYSSTASAVSIPPTCGEGGHIESGANDVTGGVRAAGELSRALARAAPTRRFAPPQSELGSSRPHISGRDKKSGRKLRLFGDEERCEIASVFAISPVNSLDRILETTKREVSS
jgi:hypothetical protein